MVRVRAGVDHFEEAGILPAANGAMVGRYRGAMPVCADAEIAQNGGSESPNCVSRMDGRAARGSDPQDGKKPGMDGGGICAPAKILEEKYRRDRGPGWARKFS